MKRQSFKSKIWHFMFKLSNKFIMKIKRERNIYLRRIFTQQPHKYSYDMSNGKYSLINKEGAEVQVYPNGSLKQQFRPNFSGCVDHKIREQLSNREPSILHYVPDAKHDSKYQNVMPLKFSGYAQSPYKLNSSPDYLKPISFRTLDGLTTRRSIKQRSMTQQAQQNSLQKSQILAQSFRKKEQPFFRKACQSITSTKPYPNRKKKLCYNDKCRYLKQITLESLLSYRQMQSSKQIDRQTLGLSFHEKYLKQQLQETKRLAKLGLSIVNKQ